MMWERIVGYVAYRGLVSGAILGFIVGGLWGVVIGSLVVILISAVLGILVGMIIGSLIGGITGFCITLIIRIRFYPPLNDEMYVQRLRIAIIITSIAVTFICVGAIAIGYAVKPLTLDQMLSSTIFAGTIPAIWAGLSAAYNGRDFVNFVTRELNWDVHRDRVLASHRK